MEDYIEHSSEASGYTEYGEFLYKLRDYFLFESNCTPWNHFFSDFLLNESRHVIPGPDDILHV
jgi:hypothetical protein